MELLLVGAATLWDSTETGAAPFISTETLLLIGTLDGVLHAIEGVTGSVVWSRSTGGRIVSSSFLTHREREVGHEQPPPYEKTGSTSLHHSTKTEAAAHASVSPPSLLPTMPTLSLSPCIPLPPPQQRSWSSPAPLVAPPRAIAVAPPFTPPSPPPPLPHCPRLPPWSAAATPSSAAKPPLPPIHDAPLGKGARTPLPTPARGEEENLLVLPGLDGSLFVIGEGGEAHPLTDYTVQARRRHAHAVAAHELKCCDHIHTLPCRNSWPNPRSSARAY